MNIHKKLYIKDNTDKIRVWSITMTDEGLIINHGYINGSYQSKLVSINEGKAGRTFLQQLVLEMRSRIKKQKDRGYVETLEEALRKPVTNALGFHKPMLAQRYDKVKNINFRNLYAQYKYNGHRCLITKHNDELIAYSRNGKLITSIDHILDDIDIDDGDVLDGELYIHGLPLQTISSFVKREQEDSKRLKFFVYDTICDAPYYERLRMLQYGYNFGNNIIIAPTNKVDNQEDIMQCFKNAKANAYEGLILRQDGYGYEDGKRSKGLIKVKSCFDDEYKVIDIIPSSDGWGILVCQMNDGKIFKVTAPGQMIVKELILRNKNSYIGQYINVSFAEYTKDGIPFHPVANYFRSKNQE